MTTTIVCATCGALLANRLAFICGDVFGDEYIESYYRCPACAGFTLEVYRDRFGAEGEPAHGTRLEATLALERLAIIARCTSPANRHCRCSAHFEYFGV